MVDKDLIIKKAMEKLKEAKTKIDWESMHEKFDKHQKSLAKELMELGPPPAPGKDSEFKAWKKQHDTINLKMKDLNDQASELIKKNLTVVNR